MEIPGNLMRNVSLIGKYSERKAKWLPLQEYAELEVQNVGSTTSQRKVVA
jgi:hypothetical protein